MLGDRLAASRKRAGMRQVELAVALGERYDQTVVSAVEHSRSSLRIDGLTRAAHALGVSTDYLLGLTDDPTPSVEREETLGQLRAQVEELSANRLPINDLADNAALAGTSSETTRPPGAQPVSVRRLQAAAGSGAMDLDEEVKTYAYFREEWLKRRGLVAEKCSIISVMGESMEPTLPDGCVVLLDHNRRSRRKGKIFVVRTEDGLVVKRAGKDPGGRWQLLSDHPAWPPQPWARAMVIGEVKWMAREL